MLTPKVRSTFAELSRDWLAVAEEARVAAHQGLSWLIAAVTSVDSNADNGYSVAGTGPEVKKESPDGDQKSP